MKATTHPTSYCSTCGQILGHDAPQGLCPRCLFALGSEGTGPAQAQLLHGYEILQEIGRGGAGVVFRALQLSLNRPVALKLLLNAGFLERHEVERFRREAETMARLQHPNIVTVHEVGEENGQPWFSMDLVDGPNLSELIRESPLRADRAAAFVQKIATALQYAHEQGVLHLDIKPSNVVLDSSGEPHVTDFGLALPINLAAAETEGRFAQGTPSYMAPEQVAPEERSLSPATDVWALGALLYHLITGRPPFVGGTAAETATHVLAREPISPRALNPSIPKDLETVCLKCLRKSPAARYSTPLELVDELRRFLSGRPVRARPVSPVEQVVRWSRRQPGLALLTLALVITLVGWAIASDRARRTAQHAALDAQAATREKQRLLTHQYLGRAYEALADQSEVRALPWLMAAWRNDAQFQPASVQEGHALRVAATLDAVPKLTTLFQLAGYGTSVDVSLDSELACAGGEDRQVLVWSTKNGARLSSWKEQAPIVRVRFTPDATKVLTASAPDRPSSEPDNESFVTVRDTTDGSLLQQWRVLGKIRSIELSRDGRYVALASSVGHVEVWDLATAHRVSGAMRHTGDARLALFTPDGESLVSGSYDRTAKIWNWRTGELKQELKHRSLVRDLQISPDGKRIATACGDGAAWLWDIGTGTNIGKPLRHKSNVYGVAFSADGKLVATASSDSTARLWSAESGEPLSSPLVHPHRATRLAFSPNGKYLLTSTSEGLLTVWDTATQARRYTLTQTGQTGEFAWLRSSDTFVTVEGSGLVRQWALPAAERWTVGRNLRQTANFLAVSPRDNQLLVGFDRGPALLWNWEKGKDPAEFKDDAPVVGGGFFAQTNWFYTFTRRGPIQVWNGATGDAVCQIPVASPIRAVALCRSTDQIAIATDSGDCSIHSADARAPALRFSFPGQCSRCAFSRNGQRFAAAWFEPNPTQPREATFTVRAWADRDRKLLVDGLEFKGEPLDLKLSSDGRFLAVSTSIGMSHLVDVDDGKILFSFPQPGEVRSVQFDPSGETLLTAGGQGVVRLWSTHTGQLLSSAASQGGVSRARFSDDGKWILTWGRDLRAQLWDVATLEPLLPPQFHDDAVIGAAVSFDHRWIVTAGADDWVRVWAIQRSPLSFEEADRQARLISGHAVDPTGAVVALSPSEVAQLWAGSAHLTP